MFWTSVTAGKPAGDGSSVNTEIIETVHPNMSLPTTKSDRFVVKTTDAPTTDAGHNGDQVRYPSVALLGVIVAALTTMLHA